MYSSSTNNNGYQSIISQRHNLQHPLIPNNLFVNNNNNSNNNNTSSSYSLFQFSNSPCLPFEEDDSILLHHHPAEKRLNMEESGQNDGGSAGAANQTTSNKIKRRGSFKKDRHSKINTAHGPRDRRMRLSLDIARKFFDLQDMLGFDKASKTVDWLLTKSNASIQELKKTKQCFSSTTTTQGAGGNTSSTTSGCVDEVVSEVINESSIINEEKEITKKLSGRSKVQSSSFSTLSRKTSFHPLAREKARERARERTREKRRLVINDDLLLSDNNLCYEQPLNHELCLVSSWSSSPLDTGEESGNHYHSNINPSAGGVQEPSTNPSPIFNYQQNSGVSYEHQFTDQFNGKPWESYNYLNLCRLLGF